MEQIEKIKRLAVAAMVSDDYLMDTLVLKGGNALDLVYQISLRASIDLDFSIEKDFDSVEIDSIKNRMMKNLKRIFNENGFDVFDIRFSKKPGFTQPCIPDFWGGYELEFKVIKNSKPASLDSDIEAMRRNAEVIGPSQKRNFKVQISKCECCRGKAQKEIEGYTVYVYTPEMLIMEKLRAICQQTEAYVQKLGKSHREGRARDFFDIYIIMDHFKIDLTAPENVDLLKDIFKAKEVPLQLLAAIQADRELHRQDFVAVEQTVKLGSQLKPYDFYFDFIVKLCDTLSNAVGIV